MPNPKPMVSKKALVSWGEGNHHVLTETFRELFSRSRVEGDLKGMEHSTLYALIL